VGGQGRDKLFGARGKDKLSGGPGPDELRGGPGKDGYNGGRGDDLIRSADGIGETIRCGPGDDRAIVDSLVNEVVHGCEDVTHVRVAARRY
jgi:Ca2+-binding RTX toxin-like protein